MEEKKRISDIIFIGKKPIMNYVNAVIMQFSKQNKEEVKIAARGKFISRAVDVVEVVRKRFLTKVKVGDVNFDSESFERERDGKKVNGRVSTINITLRKE